MASSRRDERVDDPGRATQPAVSVLFKQLHLPERLLRAPMRPEPVLRAGASSPSRRMAPGTGNQDGADPAGSRRARPNAPAPGHDGQRSPRAARAPTPAPPAPASPSAPAAGFLVVEIEMPGNASRALGRLPEPRHLRSRTAHRQPGAQPVRIDRDASALRRLPRLAHRIQQPGRVIDHDPGAPPVARAWSRDPCGANAA